MSRPPSTLTLLARAGFARLDRAKEALEVLVAEPDDFGHAADPDLAVHYLLAMEEKDHQSFHSLWSKAQFRRRLITLTGVSQGIGDFFLRHPDQWKLVKSPLSSPPNQQAYREILSSVVEGHSGENATTSLRVAYRRELARLALWDSEQIQPLTVVDTVARALADLAGATLDVALDIARADHGYSPDDVPLAIIGMGKAGAAELNYLSDVDVIYVTEVPEGRDPDVVLTASTKLARDTAKNITEFGREPALWEVDANLRPEGKDGALVRTLESHLAYYQRWASDWEFQALIKARPLAGDRDLGERYRRSVEPLIWAASGRPGFVEQVQRMRERVTENIPVEDVDYQIKLGPGGLRDIEFTIQLLQLVHGATDDSVRMPDTLGALGALSGAGYVGRAEAAEFDLAYRTLRLLEHRIQLSKLQRTHLMPRDDEAVRVLARSTRLADNADNLIAHWRGIQVAVRSLHEKLFYRPLLSAVAGLPLDGVELTSEQAALRLQASGFTNPTGALNHISALTQGVSRRASIQRTLLPVLLSWLSEGTDPDGGLLAFRTLSDDLGEAYWFLRMLRDSSGAAKRLTRVLSTSGYVAKLFGRIPEGAAWLDNDEDLQARDPGSLREEIKATLERHSGDEAQAAAALRSLRRRELLRIALGSMVGVLDIGALGRSMSELAQIFLEGLVALARTPDDGIEFAIIAMGRFGGGELGFGSDLDVLYVFRDVGAGESATDVARQIVHTITRLSDDVLFPVELDAGLRPEGKNGPLVRSLDAYRAYYERWALGWEAQALLRARDVVGDNALRTDFMAMADTVRYPEEFGDNEAREIRRIKARVESERLPQGADHTRHVKLGRGSLSDVEWAVQLFQLHHAHALPALRTTSTLEALDVLATASVLDQGDARELREAWLMASRVRTALTLFGARATEVLPVDRENLEGAARLMGYPPRSASVMEDEYLRVTRHARVVFERVFYGKK
jgi:[glutamine synthetase] adenylyltransferase / [glutamine synthetase]-adenylyl-L-tyrosine phosphorylase